VQWTECYHAVSNSNTILTPFSRQWEPPRLKNKSEQESHSGVIKRKRQQYDGWRLNSKNTDTQEAVTARIQEKQKQ
jgi:hypothetical protein